ncbi:fumarylacetoacetate hydrolase family protein [Novosphingobium album (ex Hu et al. 2023)]|uniref:Fumarylacetoacetate hydrolase family protein n=1 Tax=Novosphingobium album (ex Hu et al. 2023) TaxID=2930093 RepID=A0ABT0B791_9SPHN|nr:fumarylacetoacetate hydrolase family protein [Novosphingobium album (ex Hu et al. 2023)]MCJ2180750.1 fumarylacetoacetate hydrolase family protein [Novosphingobium album (ex Hu et al. 2023)]
MRLIRFSHSGTTRVGRLDGDVVVDLSVFADAGDSMRALLDAAAGDLSVLASVDGEHFALSDVHLEAPITDPQKFLAIGMNYEAHADEARAAGVPVPDSQLWFNKQVSCISGPTDPIVMPAVSDMLDYEAELGYVIGKTCRHVARADAFSVIAGYLVVNDVSVRDWQMRSQTMTLGKSFDTHGPIGPWITTPDEIDDPEKLEIKLWVDGEIRQNARTDDLIYKIADQIAYLSTVMTLYPGDVIATGTPSGVGAATRTWLKKGQTVKVAIEGLGEIENVIVGEE